MRKTHGDSPHVATLSRAYNTWEGPTAPYTLDMSSDTADDALHRRTDRDHDTNCHDATMLSSSKESVVSSQTSESSDADSLIHFAISLVSRNETPAPSGDANHCIPSCHASDSNLAGRATRESTPVGEPFFVAIWVSLKTFQNRIE
jgi:hypothetical protein